MAPSPSANLSTEDPPPASPDRSFGLRDWVAIAVLAGLVVFLFWKALFTSQMLFYRDIFNYSYPHARLIRQICRSGHLPYWNPYLDFGQPLLANPNTLFFYPFTLLMILLPLKIAYPLHYVVHLSLAAIGTYFLARRWQQSPLAAFFAGAFFALSGPMLSLGNFYNLAACAAWIPWALLVTDWAVEVRSWRPWVLLTMIFTLQFLAGEPMTLMATFGLATAYALWKKGSFRKPFSGITLRLLLCFFAVGSAMIALSAVALLPSLHLLFNSRRGNGLSFLQAGYWSFHPLSLLAVVLPQFFGSSLSSVSIWKLVLNSRAVPLLLSYFVGFIPFFFALAGSVLGRDTRRRFVAGAGLVLLILALGRFTPVFPVIYYALPLFRLVRYPVKFLIPAVLMLALLAGWGIDAMRDFAGASRAQRKKILVPLGAVLAASLAVWVAAYVEPTWITAPAAWILVRTNNIFIVGPADYLHPDQISEALAYLLRQIHIQFPQLIALSMGGILWLAALRRGKRGARAVAPWVAAAAVLLLLHNNYGVNPTVPGSFYTYTPPVLEHFQKTEEPYRFCYLGPQRPRFPTHPRLKDYVSFTNIPAAGNSPASISLFREKILLHFGSMLTGRENGSNNDVDASLPQSFADFWTYLRQKDLSRARYHCLLGRANVRYLVSRSQDASASVREVAKVNNGSIVPSYLYEDRCLSPRAYAVTSAIYSESVQDTLDRLSDPHYDALGQVILAGPPSAAPAVPPASAGTVKIVRRRPGRVALVADLSRPGYVVLLDRYDPDWHATLDGQPAAILRADQLFRAVRCGAGRHTINFTYRQSGLEAGFGVSLASLLVLGILFGFDPKLGRGAPPQAPESTKE